jgi:glycosyltransferase involved in cell wall biosynthesis
VIRTSAPASGTGEPLRVVHLCKVKGIAGAERHLLYLLSGLRSHGVDARLLVLQDPATPADSFCKAAGDLGIPVEVVTASRHVEPALVGRIAARLRHIRPDVVHTHMIHADLYGLEAARRVGMDATVSTRHDNNPFRRRMVIRWLNRRAMRHARRIIAISESLAAFVLDVECPDAGSVVTIHYGLDARAEDPGARDRARAALGCTAGDRVIGFVGRLIRQKGVDVLLDAFARVHASHPASRLLVVGDGPLRPALQATAARRHAPGTVAFAGWMDDAMRVMPAFDVMVAPSRWEGFGLVALEALACARPLVVSAVDALPEIVEHRRSGLLVPPDDPAALAGALCELLDDPAGAARLGQAGLDRVQRRFSVERMVRATLSVYGDVLADSRQRLRPRGSRETAGSETGSAASR